jgi:hypothetical protein
VPLALALLDEGVVLPDDEALAGKLRAGDFSEIALVEERQLQETAFGGELVGGAFSAVIQSNPAGLRSSSRRA